jgi:hypothetical protein
MFISKHYAKKVWTTHERKSAQARAFLQKKEYILPARFDNTRLPGMLPTVGYINLKEITPKELSAMIKEKIGFFERFEFLPEELDILYRLLDARTNKLKKKIDDLTTSIFNDLCLMTSEERTLLATAFFYSCPSSMLENNFHIDIDYLGRLTSMPQERILAIFSRLSCFGYSVRMYKTKEEKAKSGVINKHSNIIEIEYYPRIARVSDNCTYFLHSIFKCISMRVCIPCGIKDVKNIDFSLLSSLAGFPHKDMEIKNSTKEDILEVKFLRRVKRCLFYKTR